MEKVPSQMSRLRRNYGVATNDQLMWLFLKKLDDKTVPEQLRGCNVRSITFKDISSLGSAHKHQDDAWEIILGSKLPPKEWPFTLGHELGHIFIYTGKNDFGEKEVEKFCDNFAAAWLNHRTNLKEAWALCEEIFKTGRGDL